jgi:hypothetical protein
MNLKKNKNRILRAIPLIALALILSMTGFTTAFADEEVSVDAAITKILQMPAGTTTPTADFTFTATKVSKDGESDGPALALMPEITGDNKLKASFTSADEGTSDGAIKTVEKQGALLFDDLTFTDTGEYLYSITENSGTYTTGTGETITYSGDEYILAAYVAQKTDGAFYVKVVTLTLKDPDEIEDTKVEEDPEEGEPFSIDFTNKFTKTITDPDPDDGGVLEIRNAVSGDFANNLLYFPYTVTVTKPTLVDGTPVYKGYVVENGDVVTSSENSAAVVDDGDDDYINFTSGVATAIKLKHGQTLVFTDAHVGASYLAVLTGTAAYTPIVSVVYDGGTPVVKNDYAAGDGASTADVPDVLKLVAEANLSHADFTNDNDAEPPTGITMNNLPYILLVLLALAALAAYIVGRSRRRTREARSE